MCARKWTEQEDCIINIWISALCGSNSFRWLCFAHRCLTRMCFEGVDCIEVRVNCRTSKLPNWSLVGIWRVLTMMCNTQNYGVSGLRQSSGIPNTRKHNGSETGSVSVFRWREGDAYSVGSRRKSQPQSLDKSRNPVVLSTSLVCWFCR
jgi:hypothetical protein